MSGVTINKVREMEIDHQVINVEKEGTDAHQYHIVNAPGGVSARKGPGTSFPVVHSVANNSPIDITCQVHGEVVNGSNIWNKLADGTFVSDFYCDTPHFNAFSPPIPVCKDAPQPSPARPVIKGDDYPYKDSQPDFDGGDRWAFYARECTSFVAWRMNQLGVNFSNHMKGPNGTAGTFGNGDTWAANARATGFRVDNTPSVGRHLIVQPKFRPGAPLVAGRNKWVPNGVKFAPNSLLEEAVTSEPVSEPRSPDKGRFRGVYRRVTER
jgi:hypothetical protein